MNGAFKLVDLGDILGIGVVFKTHTGELTVRVLHFTQMLSKLLRPLPEMVWSHRQGTALSPEIP